MLNSIKVTIDILAILGEEIDIPRIKMISNRSDEINRAIPVDMVLDVGNSRTCGILIEDHVQEKNGLEKNAMNWSYVI